MGNLVAVGMSSLLLSGCMVVFDGDGDDSPSTEPPAPAEDFAARCNAPDGPALSLTTTAEVTAALAGQWWRCGGADEFRGQNVEFSSSLSFYLLTEVNGDYVRNLGPATSGTFVVHDQQPGAQLSIDTTWGDGLSPDYPLVGFITTSPRKLQLGGGRYVRMQ